MGADKTYEVMRDAVQKAGVKKVASALEVSSSLVYKWCQEPKSEKNPDASGVTNPLDRLLTVYELSDDLEIVRFMCRRAGGYFAQNPETTLESTPRFVSETILILEKFASLMRYAEQSLHDDGRIDREEGSKLRKDWDRLKGRLEQFVTTCEQGKFDISLGSADQNAS